MGLVLGGFCEENGDKTATEQLQNGYRTVSSVWPCSEADKRRKKKAAARSRGAKAKSKGADGEDEEMEASDKDHWAGSPLQLHPGGSYRLVSALEPKT